jgi:nucleoside-diphosphate-sugar epimerase
MDILITGASGFLGAAVTVALAQRSHRVTALVRSEASAALARHVGAIPAIGDILDLESIPRGTPDAVLHFASAPTESQGTARYAETDTRGMANLVARYPEAHILYASSAWVYGSGPELIGEEAPLAPTTGLGRVKVQVEGLVAERARTTVVRIGAIYPGGAFERQLVAPARRGLLLCPGRGENFLPLTSITDAAGAFVTASEGSIFGCFNVVDDQPLTWTEMTTTLARHFGKRPLGRVPLWLVRMTKGRDMAAYVGASLRVSNARARAAGFRVSHPKFSEGLRALVPN